MKRKILSTLLVLCMLTSLLPTFALAAPVYDDTNGHWAEGAIDRWSGYGVVNGKGEGSFDPDGQMTRAEAAQVFANLLGLNKEGDISAYPDAQGEWYSEAIAKCVAAGILNGKGAGKMDPNGTVTREEFLTMYARAVCISNGADVAQAKGELEQKGFADTAKVSDWAADAIGTLVEKGFVNGLTATELAPQANINRASVMALLNQSISTYVGKDSTETTVAAKSEGITLIANPAVTTVTGTADVVVVAAGAEQYDAATGEVTHNDIRVESAKMPVARVQGENITVTLALNTEAEDAEVTETAVKSEIVVESTAKVNKLTVSAEGAKATVSGKVESVTVAETAKSATVETKANSTVGTLNVAAEDAKTTVAGKVETVKVEETAKNVAVETTSTAKVTTVENKAENTAVTGTGSVGAVKSSEDVKIETKNTKVENTSETKEIAVTDSKGKETKVDSGTTGQTTPSTPTGGGDSHSHTYATEWTHDETNHWHAATCGHDVVSGKAEHSYAKYTANDDGTHTGTCECGKTMTESHTVDENGDCSKCDYHEHIYSNVWTYNETNHWHAATCVHASEKSGEAAHSYDAQTLRCICGAFDPEAVAATGDKGYTTLEDAITAAQNNGTITLLQNITIAKRTEIEGKTITLDTAGKTVTYTTNGDGVLDHEGMIRVFGGSNVTVTGNGNFTYTSTGDDDNKWYTGTDFLVYGDSTLTILNGTFNAYGTVAQAGGSNSKGTVIIRDGDFTTIGIYDNKLWTLNKKDNTGSVIQVYGGTFHGFDPSNGHTENPNDNFVAPGYAATEQGTEPETWTVATVFAGGKGTEAEPFEVATPQQFRSIVSGTPENIMYYKLTSNIYFDETQEILKDKADNYSESYLLYLDNVCLDGGTHIVSSYNHSYGDHYPFIIYKTSGNTTIKNLTVSNGNPIIRTVVDTLTLENVKTIGTVSGSDNNMCARYLQKPVGSSDVTINFINCDNESNITGSGYVGVYVGTIITMSGGTLCLNFKDCDNSGTLLSTKSGASMLISNPTNSTKPENVYFTIENCTNDGTITYAGTDHDSTLLFSLDNKDGGIPYSTLNNIYVNGTQVIYGLNSTEKKKEAINSALANCLTGTQPQKVKDLSPIGTEGGCFTFTSTENAARYELLFSFTGLSGANAGYKMVLGNTLPTDIKVGSWVALKDVAGGATAVTEHPQTGELPYYTTGEGESFQYVYNVPNASIRSKVTATLIAYDASDNMLSVATYTYP